MDKVLFKNAEERKQDVEMDESDRELFEKLADIEHQRWSDWQSYLYSKCTQNDDGSLTISSSDVEHWQKQIDTDYKDLSESEQDSDREQVERYWKLIQDFVKASQNG